MSENARDKIALQGKLMLRDREIEALKSPSPSELEEQFKHQLHELVRENHDLKNSLSSADVSLALPFTH